MEKLLPFVQKFVSSYTTLEDKMAEKSGPGEESGKIIDELSQMHFTLEDLRQNDGITYKIVYVKPEEEQELLPCVIALGQEFFGFAMDLKRYEKIDESPDSKNETSRTGVELLSQQLEEKIAESRRLAEENHPCPETVMRSLSDEMDLQVFNRYEGRDVIYRATWRGILSEPMAQLGKRLGKEFLPSGLTL